MKILEKNIKRRNYIATIYNKELKNLPIILPEINEIKNYRDVFNSYVIRTKYQFELFKHLRNKKIEALINWPYPLYKHKGLGFKGIYLDKTEKACKEIISLPIFPEIKMSEIMYITKTIKKFFVKN